MAGVAPIPASSGRRDRHRLHRGGNRQLNRALHVIAITRGGSTPRPVPILHARKPRARAGSRRCPASSAPSHATTTASSVLHRLTPAPKGSYLPSELIAASGTLLQKRFSSLKAPRTAVILRCAPVVLRHLA